MRVQDLDETLLRILVKFEKAKEQAYNELKNEGISREDIMKSLENFKKVNQ